MAPSDKDLPAGAAGNDDEAEIDKIIKEIEDLEKKMDSAESDTVPAPKASAPAEETASSSPFDAAITAAVEEQEEEVVESPAEEEIPAPRHTAKVVPMRAEVSEPSVSRAPAPRARQTTSPSSGGGALSLNLGSCTDVSLEFAKSGVTVTLTYTEDTLLITTNQGAEFRIPFKAVA